MRKTILLVLILIIAIGCRTGGKGVRDKGDLVVNRTKTKWRAETPTGMVFIPGGTFTMGKQDEDQSGTLNTPARTVTVRPFYMDETEITNGEYKKFVHWVRDSIVRTKLALFAEYTDDPANGPLGAYTFQDTVDTDNMYIKYMLENYGTLGDINSPTMGRFLKWDEDLVWNPADFPSMEYAEVMDSMYLPLEECFDGRRMIDVRKLKYEYVWLDRETAARKQSTRSEQMHRKIVEVYPDTTVWVKDFNYSYNDPMHQDYFWHPAYTDYPVVGVNWHQANAFSNWRTKYKNDYIASLPAKKKASRVSSFRLPLESEWEYAARGGIEFGKYPWGGIYTTSDQGCFLANFKPARGDYAVDGALYTMEAKSYNKNGYGLYNMAGNVAEWTKTAYNEGTYYFASTMNPNVEDSGNGLKIVRGGSWKDIAYFLEVSSRDFEYADTARSYIGFRTVQDYLGTDMKGK
ncbi:MAG: gliding motility lipoprotein GldK [Flavobacteriia bacterium]|nr:MAG: gliding motility lipoprotein GldK [Flavobacteriia bacterium]